MDEWCFAMMMMTLPTDHADPIHPGGHHSYSSSRARFESKIAWYRMAYDFFIYLPTVLRQPRVGMCVVLSVQSLPTSMISSSMWIDAVH